ncbi:MAG TPA: quinohemoprotein amine dehydrogenase subunit alpha [Bryobacteraceae bacterium]|jgi:quinohemoprotein amine dehydrogenase|nr:quinohemoprotein amine dehydrogenase subunit alpha [Bryobacteraceae bacterium]
MHRRVLVRIALSRPATDPMNLFRFLTILVTLIILPVAFGQRQRGGGDNTNTVPPESEPGIPVTDKLTIDKCSSCHKADDKGNLTRISWIRTTPEGWEEAIKRMVRLNGLVITPVEARHILSYLSSDHGVAPEEIAERRWFLEMRQPETEPIPNAQIRMACASCHAFARPETWFRSSTEWKLLENMHLGYFPVAENNSFHARQRPEGVQMLPVVSTPPGGPTKDPVDEALEYLDKNQGLHSAAWSNWRASLRDPDLKGRWALSATSPGKGRYFGFLTVTQGSSPDAFTTEATLTRVADGSKVTLKGQSVVYTGYEWRGRSKAEPIGTVREVMALSPDQSKMEGRWFWGDYQEFGFNMQARRESSDITVLGTDVTSIHAGSKDVPVKIFGEKFPRGVTPADIVLGAGVHVSKVVAATATELSVLVDVDTQIVSGFRSASVKTGLAPNAFAVYDKIDYIKVSTDSALARLGGTTHPKGYVQFEAVGYNRGLDGVANTADDINLGPIPVKWSMEEFISRFNDDDKEFVGSLSAEGLFTPAGEGPNPQRRFMTNNTGDVWVVAKYKDAASGPTPLEAKGYLVVTVPVYMKWDEPEVAQ